MATPENTQPQPQPATQAQQVPGSVDSLVEELQRLMRQSVTAPQNQTPTDSQTGPKQ